MSWGDETLPRVIHPHHLCLHRAKTFQSCSCTGVGGRKRYRVKPKCLSIFWRSLLHWATHPRAGGAAGALLRLPDNPDYTEESSFTFFLTTFMTPSSLKQGGCKQLGSSGLCMVSVGKADTDGSTSSGFAFTIELMDGFLDDAHTVAHQWLTTKENSNQSCT